MLRLNLAIVSLLSMFAAACGSSSPSTAPSPPAPPGAPSSSVTIPMSAQSLGNGAYSPSELNVAAGTTVSWMNVDSIAHTSTSDATGWNSGIIAPGGQFSIAFQAAGTFPYHCAIHPGMVGTVVVR